ncbi:hypothetical protein EW146_g6492 [Bondarzewia mesenterica]|uniref:DUF6534 domain-containing protein n=1 Tax=Bondarzewia mesenterica TaxID=1095465 RepID=A0A4S4LP15_9AGAM|nr:hypothetical protein EW146_g6492 [Bondarzewia mesenterica]
MSIIVTMAPLPGVPSNVALIQGPLLLGYLFGYGLLGILVIQLLLYHANFPNDHLWIKILVWIVFLAEIVATVITTVAAWRGLAAGWGDLDTLRKPGWALTALPVVSAFTAVSALQWIMAFYITVQEEKLNNFSKLSSEYTAEVTASTFLQLYALSAAHVCQYGLDCTCSLFNPFGWMQTQSLVNKLIKLTVETGAITALGAGLEVIFYRVFQDNNLHFLFFLVLAKLYAFHAGLASMMQTDVSNRCLRRYSNTLLATLNARAMFKQGRAASINPNSGERAVALWEDSHPQALVSSNRAAVNTKTTGISVTKTVEARDDMQMVILSHGSQDDSASLGKPSADL